MQYATRLNSFATRPELFRGGSGTRLTVQDQVERAAGTGLARISHKRGSPGREKPVCKPFPSQREKCGLDPVAECEANIAAVGAMLSRLDEIHGDNRLADALQRQDPIAVQAVLRGRTQPRTAG